MDLVQALAISARGMDAQTERLRVIAETLASGDGRGSMPPRRAVILSGRRLEHDPVRTGLGGLAEMTGMRAAELSSSANLGIMQTSRSMLTRTIDLLR